MILRVVSYRREVLYARWEKKKMTAVPWRLPFAAVFSVFLLGVTAVYYLVQ